jgi:hypothetical protein
MPRAFFSKIFILNLCFVTLAEDPGRLIQLVVCRGSALTFEV